MGPTQRHVRRIGAVVRALRYAGTCNVCGHHGLFRVRQEAMDNLRESLE